eukprot:m.48016 g.48016  ORF g.48016 m.48016 type:complete len:209 (-) comp6949_c1_seq1:136-762(-)
MRITVKYGKDAHAVDVPEGCRMGDLCDKLEQILAVPRHMQKLVFKGKSAQAPPAGETGPHVLDTFKLREGAKLMLLGRKLDPGREALMEILITEDKATQAVAADLDSVQAQLDRVEQGFADHLNLEDSLKALDVKIAGCVDALEKGLERLDAAETQASDRELRKSSVLKIQEVLTRADTISDTIASLRTAPAPTDDNNDDDEDIIDVD